MVKELPVPSFFDPAKVGKVWSVKYADRMGQAEAWAKQHGIKPSASDKFRVCLMEIDFQNTFCIPDSDPDFGGQLYVGGQSGTGAVDDISRTAQFIYRNLPYITSIEASMDTHRAMQIFHPYFWVNANHEHPAPMTVITVADVEGGVWTVNPMISASVAGGNYTKLLGHALHYVKKLEANGKYPLIIWPHHAMLGGIEHALVPTIHEANQFHLYARGSQTGFEVKGGNFLTENYSVLGPEVTDTVGGEPLQGKNTKFIEKLLNYDAVIIAGEAKSHCVAWTIADLLSEINAKDPTLAQKVYLLEDATSPVVVPGVIDFTAEADQAFADFDAAGMNVVRTDQPIDTWKGFNL